MLDDSWRMAARVWILMEKKAFRCNLAKIKKIPEKYGNILFYQKTKKSRRRDEEGPQGAHTPEGTGPPDPAPRAGVAHLLEICPRGNNKCSYYYIFVFMIN